MANSGKCPFTHLYAFLVSGFQEFYDWAKVISEEDFTHSG
jgi:hypothetical protein